MKELLEDQKKMDHKVQNNYDCDLCTSSFKGMEDLFFHVADAHKKHPCDMCEKVFLKMESLESHCQVVHHMNLNAIREKNEGKNDNEVKIR